MSSNHLDEELLKKLVKPNHEQILLNDLLNGSKHGAAPYVSNCLIDDVVSSRGKFVRVAAAALVVEVAHDDFVAGVVSRVGLT